MHSEFFWTVAQSYLETILPIKFKEIVGKAGITPSDEDEFAQEMSRLVWMRRTTFDPARASAHTYADRIVTNGAKMFVRNRRTKKRGGGRPPQSIDAELHSPFKADKPRRVQARRDMLSVTERGRHLGLDGTGPRQGMELDDLRAAIRDLPEHLHATAVLLTKGVLPATIAREQGRSRRQVTKDLAEIRKRLGIFNPRDSDEKDGHERTR